MSELDKSISTKADELTTAFNKLVTSGGVSTTDSGFSVISLTSGQTLTCSVGTEIMLRIGSVSSAGSSSPRLIDETTGSSVTSSGTALTKNHMYMVTIQGNGITATSSAKVLIRGSYTIS
jgi:hypothetical protein